MESSIAVGGPAGGTVSGRIPSAHMGGCRIGNFDMPGEVSGFHSIGNGLAIDATGRVCRPNNIPMIRNCIELGYTGHRFTRDGTIQIGFDLTNTEGNINFADIIISDSETKNVTIPRSLTVNEGIGLSHDLCIKYISCDICETDEERSERLYYARILNQNTDGKTTDGKNNEHPTTDDLAKAMEYTPKVKPGFEWTHDGYNRTMCINCIYESSFDFMANRRLQEYNESKEFKEPQESNELSDNTLQSSDTIKLQERLSQLEAIVQQLLKNQSQQQSK